jgi:alkylation response protein AidB-like acyl-CoA dehydrogenase
MGLDDLKLKNVSERDRVMIRDIERMMGPEPADMGFAKNLFWGRLREDQVFPYPVVPDEERVRCDALVAELEQYLRDEHPAVRIDREQAIPRWVIERLFRMGVMGMTIPEQYGGLGFGITSYNRVLETIGRTCASTAVVVSAHQSIGCKALMLFGNEEQKREYLPKVAREYLSAFCLSEPNAGSDAQGLETTAVKSEDGTHFIVNGEKKWATSAPDSGFLTVMANQEITDPATGRKRRAATALIVTPDMEGVDIFEKNRSKVSIRGTWQGRVRLTNVKVPVANVLHREGKGINVALGCLNFGRCTLSAGVTGAAKQAMDQAVKWVQTRYQFGRPIAEFELVQQRIARMAAYTFAMDATLYMMTGLLDANETDIMVETAMTKVFCSQHGWEVLDDAMQIMGGEAFMTENEIERSWRDNRLHRAVEGSNEVMQPFIFAYGGKQLVEQLIGIQDALGWDSDEPFFANLVRMGRNALNPRILARAVPLAAQLYLGLGPAAPRPPAVHAGLRDQARRLSNLVRTHSHQFKLASKRYREEIIGMQAVQARIADNAMLLFALTASLSRMDHLLRSGASGPEHDRDRAAFEHAFDLFELRILRNISELGRNADATMRRAAEATRRHNDTLPNDRFYIHEGSPVARGEGRPVVRDHVEQFPGEVSDPAGGDGQPMRSKRV